MRTARGGGPAAFNGDAADEHVLVEERVALGGIFAVTAFGHLNG